MSNYKEFTGKTLDAAIKEACAFFNVEREKLEIEIVNDAKTGIFGLVGAKKATVRARKVSLDDIGLSFPAKEEKTKERGGRKTGRAREESPAGNASPAGPAAQVGPAGPAGEETAGGAPRTGKRQQPHEPREADKKADRETKKQPPAGSLASRRAADPAFTPESAPANQPAAVPAAPSAYPAIRPQTLPAVAADAEEAASGGNEARSRSKGRNRGKGRSEPAGQAGETGNARQAQRDKKNNPPRGADARRDFEADAALPLNEDDNGFEDQLPEIPLEELNQDALRQTVLDTLRNLVAPLAGEAESSLSIEDGRVRVRLEIEENQGLLIGRDGQTLSALQYLLTCITSRKLGASVRVQIDAGDYREKQEEKLRALALALAQKVKSTQRPQSTRPLSSYHRRIIHVTLQDDPDVQTHSKSEGNLKSVVIVPRRKNSGK